VEGVRGVGDWEKRGWEVYGRPERRGAGSGIPKVAGSGTTGLKGTGNRRSKPPCLSPPPGKCDWKVGSCYLKHTRETKNCMR